jgi:hypothetical protein
MTKVENYADVRHDDRRLQEYGVVLGQRGGTPGMSSVKKCIMQVKDVDIIEWGWLGRSELWASVR